MEGLDNKKRARVDSDESTEFEKDSPEVKRLREDLLSCLDESDPGTTDPDLGLFMKSFEEEILASPAPAKVTAVFSGESVELEYLLEASDDELGLPPSTSSDDVAEVVTVQSDSGNGLSELWRIDDDQVPSYNDSFEFGVGFDCYDPVDGLFEYADVGGASYDATESLWRPEAEPAV